MAYEEERKEGKKEEERKEGKKEEGERKRRSRTTSSKALKGLPKKKKH